MLIDELIKQLEQVRNEFPNHEVTTRLGDPLAGMRMQVSRVETGTNGVELVMDKTPLKP